MVTPFQQEVYNLLRKIPKGKVTTYKILAEQLNMNGYQAIGTACKMNPFALKIPCHRVVHSDGSLGGYQGRMNHPEKIRLLAEENIPIKDSRIINFKKYLYQF